VKTETRPGRYGDGGGLYLQVKGPGQRSWLFRFMLRGKAREMGLGSVDTVRLAEARDLARDMRGLVARGIDPIAHRRQAREELRATATFEDVAALYIGAHEAGWRNEKHRGQWRTTLAEYVYPTIGKAPIAGIDAGQVLAVLEPIWRVKPETASRLRGRIEAVLDYATSRGWRVGDNPARWRGHLANLLPARRKVRAVKHHAALPWKDIGAFMGELRQQPGTGARALEFVILTAARTSEATGATWSEIDLAEGVWTVPAERMKAAREHRVPLNDQALAVLRALPRATGDAGEPIFQGRAGERLSAMALTMVLRRMNRAAITVHGFRSAFRDWAAEATSYPREVAEAALAHTLKDKTEAAYRRGDLFARRAAMMRDWGAWCDRPPNQAGITSLHAARAERVG
jgi:integrase